MPRLFATRTQVCLPAFFLAVAAIGFARMAYFHFSVEPHRPVQPQIDGRYRAARSMLPASGEVGYVSDRRVARRPEEVGTSTGTRLYVEAQYSLAPLVLRVDDDRAATVLVNVADPAEMPRLLAGRRLRLVDRAGAGVAIARPLSP